MKTCVCSATLNNSGTPDCQPLMSFAEMIIAVPKYGSTGALNFIDLTDTLDADYFNDKINAEDPRDRWYPLPRVKNAASTKADSEFQTFDDASKIKVRDGLRSWTMIIPKQTPQFLGKIETFACSEFGIYVVDKTKNLIGSLKAEGELYPIVVDENSWNPVLAFATSATVQLINLGFDFDSTEQDSDLQMITANELNPINLLTLKGLIDVTSVITNISTTGFKAKLNTAFGSALTPIVVKGLVSADFISSVTSTASKIRNQNDSADVAITSVTENPDGTYTFVFAAQGSGEVLILKPSKDGFDFSAVEAATITIP